MVWCTTEKRKQKTHIPLNQDGRSVHVVTWKLYLDQMSMGHTHTERHKYVIKLTFRLLVTQNST